MENPPNSKIVRCDYCGQYADLVTGADIYPHRPDLKKLTFWQCKPCDAYVGTHKNTRNLPLGRLANAELRQAKQAAHAAFDPIWKANYLKRNEAYRWLASQMGIDRRMCHIGMFDVAQCRQVVELARNVTPMALRTFKESLYADHH